MKRLLSLCLLISACAAPAPRGTESAQQEAAAAACRQEAERTMRYRERGQTMRWDEAESRIGSAGFMGSSFRNQQLGARYEQDRMVQDCLRGQQPGTAPATAAPPQGGGRGS
ncbi:hypothetical protein [Teichococcus vastitatis]|uniref:Lipoprotein n=1 Tax=Teichococcus vastitatis TaxID=2307076 RepID=A0ABS9W235_9PROT|nr:hypothetical protein [Pseudoroseomonas vastitatis]MCI0753236.1 hypothetical protein [Pseudoroseomonas vastitatis]